MLSGQQSTIPSGYIRCFITGELRKDTPEERIRQDVARILVEEYKYDKRDIAIEFPIKMGRTIKRADIVIFSSGKEHTQENVYIVVEVKPEDIKPDDKKEGIAQLHSYVAACPNAKFALWVGNERRAFRVVEKGEKIIEPIPDIPRKGEGKVSQPTPESLVRAVNLKQVFKRIHNYIYANQGFQKDKAFEELLKLIFIKVYDEQFSRPDLQFYILPNEDVNNVRQRLENLFNNVKNVYKYIFHSNEKIELDDRVLKYVVSELQRFSFIDTEADIKGEAYEEIVGPNLRGDRGEFFTPRNVCNMLIDMLFSLVPEKELTKPGAIKILDPAVGTGGFLIAGIQKIKSILLKRGIPESQLRNTIREIANNNFYGIDFNPFLVKVAQMNMFMHGDGSSNIFHANSLENLAKWPQNVKEKIKLNEFDIVVTNPPFGTKPRIDDQDILSQYELTILGKKSSLPPEQLFIERCLQFLKPGGYLGIVLPDSILSNPGLKWIREWILKKTYIIASIDLPTETFEPYTGTQTSVLILQKKTQEQEKLQEDYEIFMAIPEKVGHDRRGNPIYKTTPEGNTELDENGNPIIEDDLPKVVKAFKEWLKTKGAAI